MNQNRLTLIGRVSLLCLIAGSFSGNTSPALADTPNTMDKNQPEPLAKIEASTTEGAIANSNIDSATKTESISSTIVKLDQTDTNKYDTPVLPQTQQLDLEISEFKIKPDEQRNNNNSSLPSESNTVAQLIESNNLDSSGLEQVTSVSQLSDVRPSDWAYEALRNLVERYGCIAGYPDGTFRGNRAMTRYEFAAGLNACLQQIERLLGNNPPNTNPQDLTTLRRLVDEFQVELSTLGARVDKIEGRVISLEEHQFSTTTKLEGEAIFSLVGATGGDPDTGDNANLILVDRVRLNLKTSFTGKDLLITGLQANNFGGDAFGSGSVQGTLFPGRDAFLSEGSTKLSFEPQFPRFTPQDLSTTNGSNNVQLYKLLYIFPSGIKNITLFGGTSAEVSDAFPTIIPFASEGQGAISRFATLNPVLRVSGGTSQTGLASAAGFIWGISDKLDFRALYGSVNAAIPNQGANNVLGAGFFSGSSVAAAQLTVKPNKNFDIGLNYAHSYHDLNILGIGNSRYSSSPLFIPGQTQDLTGNLNLAGTLNTPIHVNSIGATLTWRVAPKIAFTGYGSYFFVDSAAGANASSNFSSWMVGLHFQDLLKEGNSAGLIFGQPLYRVSADGAAKLAEPDVDRATPYHLEAFYNFRVNDNISITPGAFILFNPEGDAHNDTTVVGAIRTTFTF